MMCGVEGLRFFGFGAVVVTVGEVVVGAGVERGKGAIAVGMWVVARCLVVVVVSDERRLARDAKVLAVLGSAFVELKSGAGSCHAKRTTSLHMVH